MAHSDDPAPDNLSSAYEATEPSRTLVHDMLAGLPAIQAKPEVYLTKWPQETDANYDRRLDEAAFTPLFADLLFGLTSKPFAKEVSIKDGATPRIEDLMEDVDGEGNNLTTFARHAFHAAYRDGYCGILVDYPVNPGTANRRQEAEMQLRPYWVRIEAADILALYTETRGGVEVITHTRLMERSVKRVGFTEVEVARVRVLEPGTWTLWELVKGEDGKGTWTIVGEGTTSLDYVPLVLVYTNDRMGPQYVLPPLVNLARMQVELFRQENALKNVENRAAFPMIAANGMSPPTDGNDLVVGPFAILYGGEGGKWEILEPAGSSMEHLHKRIEETKAEMRRLGMQPLMPGSGTVTATATATEAAKAHSAVQQAALALKDGLENALRMTGDWLGEQAEAEVFIHTDFDIGFMSDQSIQAVLALKEQGAISRRAELEEMKRRGVMMADYDIDADEELIAEEREALLADMGDLMPVDGAEAPADGAAGEEPAAPPAPAESDATALLRGFRQRMGAG